MVTAVRKGQSRRSVARRFHVSLLTVQRWMERAQGRPLDRVDWGDRPSGPHLPHRRVAAEVEELVLRLRQELKTTSALGEYGAQAIAQEMRVRGFSSPLSLRTIGRILERRGALDGRARIRRPPPPKGWYLPEVAARQAELDSFDIVEGLALQGGEQLEVLTGISLHGGLAAAWPMPAPVTTEAVLAALQEHWQECGLPSYLQFDNDPVFHGPHHFPNLLGRVTRLCLALHIIPVFTPPHETGFQAAIEHFNGLWQAKVWNRFHHASLTEVQERSARYVAAHRARAAGRREAAPSRRPFSPPAPAETSTLPSQGKIIFLRRANERGEVALLGQVFQASSRWPHRLVRCEVALETPRIRFLALRRKQPLCQSLLCELEYYGLYNRHPKP